MGRFAEKTDVSAEKSRAEVEKTLTRYGANAFAYGWQGTQALIQFEMKGRRIRFVLPMPDRNSKEFLYTPVAHQRRTSAGALEAWEQATRQRWRAPALAVKAKLEAVESGITTFEEEFMAHIVLPNGATVGAWIHPQLEDAYRNNRMPPMLGYDGGTNS